MHLEKNYYNEIQLKMVNSMMDVRFYIKEDVKIESSSSLHLDVT